MSAVCSARTYGEHSTAVGCSRESISPIQRPTEAACRWPNLESGTSMSRCASSMTARPSASASSRARLPELSPWRISQRASGHVGDMLRPVPRQVRRHAVGMTPLPPVPDPALAPALRARLVGAGYSASGVSALLGSVAERALARGEPAAARRRLRRDGSLETLVRLFLLADPVSPASAKGAFGDLVDERSLLRPDDEGGLRATIDIRPYGDDWYVVSDLRPPSGAAPLDPEAVVGIGSASVTLASTIPVATGNTGGGTALDLGTGPGVQALHLAASGAQVTGTDTSRRALQMAALTAALSDVALELVEGDLFEPVAGRRFDRIVANPPFVIG